MTVKHSPGPWRLSLTDDTIVLDANGNEVADISGDYNDPELWPVMEANARLIAAADDMWRALRTIANDRDDCVSPGMKALAVEVLAKVERAPTSHYCTACGRNVPGTDEEHLSEFHLFGPTSARRVQTDDDEYLIEIRRAQAIIDRMKEYREQLLTMPCQSTGPMRDRIRELSTPARDDHDRAVLMLLDDFEKMERLTRASVKAEALRAPVAAWSGS